MRPPPASPQVYFGAASFILALAPQTLCRSSSAEFLHHQPGDVHQASTHKHTRGGALTTGHFCLSLKKVLLILRSVHLLLSP